MTGHVPEFGGHDAETVGHDAPKYATRSPTAGSGLPKRTGRRRAADHLGQTRRGLRTLQLRHLRDDSVQQIGAFIGQRTGPRGQRLFNPMSPETTERRRPHAKRSGIEFEEERAWVSFYRRVGHDLALATEVLAQLEADPAKKHAHLALLLCCKESLRSHKARQARNKRIGQFVRWLCHGLFTAPMRMLRRGGDIAVECLPETGKEPAVRQVRRLTRKAEFARAQSAFGPQADFSAATPTAAGAETATAGSSQGLATRSAA